MRRTLTVSVVSFLSLFLICKASAQVDMIRLKVNDEISLKMPESFIPMTEAEMINKYMSYRTPLAMFTSEDRTVDFGINKNSSPWAGNDLTILKDFYKANVLNLFTEVKFIQDDIINISGRDFAVLEFVSRIDDEESTFGSLNKAVSKYSYIMYTLHQGNVLLFNFTCGATGRAKWQQPANEIMQSIRIKE
ncbi:hypothetical protein [Marinoscillum sp. MHG1-6]|uniref:hypothetical protein n=1 Tax=Marinoscillum sp. MHG1-6 TaxID=2959627 RepID=UPI0021584BEE|nr:hypothetical protein [Marinoscillum sp. MHG1-6]